MKRLMGILRFAWVALIAAAVIQQLQRPANKRSWTGHVLGIPYDFRVPTLERVEQRWWNPKNPNILTPHVFGIGWGINLYQVKRQLESLAS